MDRVTRGQILGEFVCILHSANAIKKSIYLTSLLYLWLNIREVWYGNLNRRKIILNLNLSNLALEIDLVSLITQAEEL